MKPTEKQPSLAMFSVFDGLICIIFFNRKNFEQAALNIQIWVGVMHNIKIHKCYFLGLVALSPGNSILKYCTKSKHAHTLSANFILVSFVDWLTSHRTEKNYNCYIMFSTFYRPDKVFSREHPNMLFWL